MSGTVSVGGVRRQHHLDHPQVFKEAIKAAVAYKENSTDIMDAIMRELEVGGAGVGGAGGVLLLCGR